MASKPQFLTLCGAVCLPFFFLAMLTGFLVSLILPVALSSFISAMDSAFFKLLPELLDSFLSWVTPPCLFLFLNGIIFVLTASSGMLSSSVSSSGSSDCHANLLSKIERSPKQGSRPLLEDLSSAAIHSTNLQETIGKQTCTALMVDLPALSLQRPCAVFDAYGNHLVKEGNFHDAEEGGGGGGEEEEEEEEDVPCISSKLAVESRSLSFSFAESRIHEEEEEDEGDEYGAAWSSSRYPKQALVSKKLPFFCREEGDEEQRESRSLPTSPHFVKEPKANSIKRSLSVDSASFHCNQGSTLQSAESLSDEAFKKRVEDFISKMNAQLRNEANK